MLFPKATDVRLARAERQRCGNRYLLVRKLWNGRASKDRPPKGLCRRRRRFRIARCCFLFFSSLILFCFLDLQVEVPLPRPMLVGFIGPPIIERGRVRVASVPAWWLAEWFFDNNKGLQCRMAYGFRSGRLQPAASSRERSPPKASIRIIFFFLRGLFSTVFLGVFGDVLMMSWDGKPSCCLARLRWCVGPSTLEKRPVLRRGCFWPVFLFSWHWGHASASASDAQLSVSASLVGALEFRVCMLICHGSHG